MKQETERIRGVPGEEGAQAAPILGKMMKRGPLAYIVPSIVIWVGTSAIIYQTNLWFFRLGWFHFPSPESFLEVFGCAAATGIVVGWVDWFSMMRKIDALPPENGDDEVTFIGCMHIA